MRSGVLTLNFDALTYTEQQVLYILFVENKALQKWDIYRDFVRIAATDEKKYTPPNSRAVEVAYMSLGLVAYVLLNPFLKSKQKEWMNAANLEATAKKLKKQKPGLVSFPTLGKTIDALLKAGLLEKRQIRGRRYYSLAKIARDEIEKINAKLPS